MLKVSSPALISNLVGHDLPAAATTMKVALAPRYFQSLLDGNLHARFATPAPAFNVFRHFNFLRAPDFTTISPEPGNASCFTLKNDVFTQNHQKLKTKS